MIPKIIHYCWFGRNPLPEDAAEYINSWKKYCSDYEIKEWNEDNFDLNACDYVKEAYAAKKWAFVTDYVRLYAMVSEGGIYMDTDVELIRPIDKFLNHKAFSGFEDETNIPTGLMACEKGFPLFDEMLHYYDDKHFVKDDGTYDMTTNVETITKICGRHGFVPNGKYQEIDGFALYPHDVFCPKSHTSEKISLTESTVAIHHFSGSWQSKSIKTSRNIKNWFSKRKMDKIGKMAAFPWTLADRISTMGFKKAIKYFAGKCIWGEKSEL